MIKKDIFVITILSLAMITSSWAITNGDFEYGDITPWIQGGTGGAAGPFFGGHNSSDWCAQLTGAFGKEVYIDQVETAANVGETWAVEGWAYKSGGFVEFGWFGLGHTEVPVNAGSWTKYTDQMTFSGGDSKEVDFYLSGIGYAYLDDVVTYKIVVADTSAPTWSTTTGVVNVTNPAPGQIQVTWGIATDAQTPPVKYNLYRNTSMPASAGVKFANVTSPYLLTGLAGGRTYYFTVRSEDSSIPPNETTNEDNKSILLPTGVTGYLWELYQ